MKKIKLPHIDRDKLKSMLPHVDRDKLKIKLPQLNRDRSKTVPTQLEREEEKRAPIQLDRSGAKAAPTQQDRGQVKASSTQLDRGEVKAAPTQLDRGEVKAAPTRQDRGQVKKKPRLPNRDSMRLKLPHIHFDKVKERVLQGAKHFGNFFMVWFSRFIKDRITLLASGIVYTTLMSLIPFVSFLLAFLALFDVLQPFFTLLADLFESLFGTNAAAELVGMITHLS